MTWDEAVAARDRILDEWRRVCAPMDLRLTASYLAFGEHRESMPIKLVRAQDAVATMMQEEGV